MYNEIDPILHVPSRLAIVSLLLSAEEVEFNYIKNELKMTAGNLSFQLTKLEQAGYIILEKKTKNNYPLTLVRLTKPGRAAFDRYTQVIIKFLKL
jgi:DNA-binding MarR family transcriptional regulator